MEANFFRFLAVELGSLLNGRRIDKIFGPAPGVWTLALQNTGEPLYLLFRPAKSAGHFFVSTTKPVNPQDAPAMAMWFRKRLRNRKILSHSIDWPNLRLALELTPRDEPKCGRFLIFDIRNGMELTDELDAAFSAQPDWPALEDVRDDSDIWREYPHISPPLRKVLTVLPDEAAHQLYMEIASGTATTFFLSKTENGWQPPHAWKTAGENETFTSALEAANAYGDRTLFPLMEMEEDKPEQTVLKRARKKIKRNLASLDTEEARLQKLADEKIKAEAMQAELYRFKGEEGLEEITVTHPEHGAMTVPLNPYLTPLENMERYFKLAAKAERGFPHVKRRRRELLRQLEQLESGCLPETTRPGRETVNAKNPPPSLPNRYKGLAVSLFRSSDGFTIIRGKNKKANHDMLSRAASPFDYWLHVEDGPSSHIILKRDHPSHDVPETTLVEAAILCGLKSYRKDDGKADIMYALVKDVRKVKGFAQGQVMVDKKLGTIRVDLDPNLEKSLA